jgi:hypothetical protein
MAMVARGRTVFAKTGRGKVRLAAIEMVHGSAGATKFGLQKNLWSPAAVGKGFDLSVTALSPLEPFRDYLTIVSNTDVRNAEAFELPEIGGDHFRSSAVFLTQSHPRQTQGSDVAPASRSTRSTRRSSGRKRRSRRCSLCIEAVDQAGGCSYGYSCVYTDTISWADKDQPLPMIRDPRLAFDQLFGVGATPGGARRAARRRQEHPRLDQRAAQSPEPRDRRRRSRRASPTISMKVREIERRIQKVEAYNKSGEPREIPTAPVGVPDSFDEHVRLMFDLQALAFASDTTRVFSFKMGRDASSRVYPNSGVSTGFHPASHHGDREDRILDFAKINRYHVGMLPYFLKKLKETPDGDEQPDRTTRWSMYRSRRWPTRHPQPHRPLPADSSSGKAGRRVKGRAAPSRRRRHADGQRDARGAAGIGVPDLTLVWRQQRAPWILSAVQTRRGSLEPTETRDTEAFSGLSYAQVDLSFAVLSFAVVLPRPAPIASGQNGDREAVRSLLKKGPRTSTSAGRRLHRPALGGDIKGDAEMAQMLIYAGANVRATTRIGAYTPLYLAAKGGYSDVVAALLAAGADAKAVTANGTTPLMIAAAAGDTRSITSLIENGADINAMDGAKGETPLIFAAGFNRTER